MVDKNYEELTHCLICGSRSALIKLFSVDDVSLTGVFPADGDPEPMATPVSIWRCSLCNSIQAGEVVKFDKLFIDYWYRSSTTQSMQSHLKNIVKNKFQSCRSWLDIGSNDGTLLIHAQNYGIKKLCGVEPSSAYDDCLPTIKDYCVNDFFGTKESMRKIQSISERYDIISAISMFYDIADPVSFLKNMKGLLSEHGQIIIEVNYAKDFFEKGNVDMLGQEHLIYYFISTMDSVCQKAGLFINDAYLTDMNGGNITFTISTEEHQTRELTELIMLESNWLKIFDFFQFGLNVSTDFEKLRQKIIHMSKSQSIKILGASTRGALIAQWLKLTPNLIDSAVDLQQNKVGRRIPGTGIKIELDGFASPPDCYLVMPYQFKSEILKRYDKYMQDGGKLMFYRPKMEIYQYKQGNIYRELI